MDDENFSSDTSDDDYVPAVGADESDVEESSNNSDEGSDSTDDKDKKDKTSNGVKRTRGKTLNHSSKKKKTGKLLQKKETHEKKETCKNEDNKQRIDELWAGFKTISSTGAGENSSASTSCKRSEAKKIYEFAGEKVEITEEVKTPTVQKTLVRKPPLRVGGISSLASRLDNKKPKLSTLEKSKLDWDRFKNDEGIAEDLKSFNQGKQGFLERKAFLERTDLKQFEIEKSLRAGRKT